MITYKKPNQYTAPASIIEYVYLEGKRIGAIKKDSKGFFYKPSNYKPSEDRFEKIEALKKTLEAE